MNNEGKICTIDKGEHFIFAYKRLSEQKTEFFLIAPAEIANSYKDEHYFLGSCYLKSYRLFLKLEKTLRIFYKID